MVVIRDAVAFVVGDSIEFEFVLHNVLACTSSSVRTKCRLLSWRIPRAARGLVPSGSASTDILRIKQIGLSTTMNLKYK